jgi:hypothetical protein
MATPSQPPTFIQRIGDGTGLLGPNGRRAFKLPAGWTIVDHPLDTMTGNGDGQVTGYLELVPPASLSAARELLISLATPASNSGDGPSGLVVVQPSTDYPGATTCKFYATAWLDRQNAPPNWAQNTAYTSGQWVQAQVDGAYVAYRCTTGGTSSTTGTGPTGFGTNITDGPGSAVRWASQVGSIEVLLINPTIGQVTAATIAVSQTLAAVLTSPGPSGLEFTADLTSALMGVNARTLVLVGFNRDPNDNGGTIYTTTSSGGSKLIFE